MELPGKWLNIEDSMTGDQIMSQRKWILRCGDGTSDNIYNIYKVIALKNTYWKDQFRYNCHTWGSPFSERNTKWENVQVFMETREPVMAEAVSTLSFKIQMFTARNIDKS